MQSSLSSIHGKRFHFSTSITKPNSTPPSTRKSLLHLPRRPSSPPPLTIHSQQIESKSLLTRSNPPFRTPNPNQPIIPSTWANMSRPLPPLLCGMSSNTFYKTCNDEPWEAYKQNTCHISSVVHPVNHVCQVVLAAALLHASGLFFGYLLSRMLGLDVSSSRTVSIEVGMLNSGLGVILATQHFGDPLTAVPGAVCSVYQSIFGSALAGIWRSRIPESPDQEK